MKPPFDIAGDLDTPVSAFAKLGAFNPRFLLESVEGGERLARYSFIGFGKCLEVRLDAAGLTVGDSAASAAARPGGIVRRAAPGAGPRAASRCPKWPACRWPADWSGYSSYDVVRYFERLPAKARADRAGARPALRGARVACWCSIT